MKPHPSKTFAALRAVHRPEEPALDTNAIMDAIRREAAVRPLSPRLAAPVAAIPTWACAVAASLALLAAAAMAWRAVDAADQQIGQAWLSSIEPHEFEISILSPSEMRL